jgi:hypothetical protein
VGPSAPASTEGRDTKFRSCVRRRRAISHDNTEMFSRPCTRPPPCSAAGHRGCDLPYSYIQFSVPSGILDLTLCVDHTVTSYTLIVYTSLLVYSTCQNFFGGGELGVRVIFYNTLLKIEGIVSAFGVNLLYM